MSQERRIGRVYEHLSVTERARIILDAYKSSCPPDPLLAWSTPLEQRSALSDLVDQLHSTNVHIAWLLTSWEARTRLLQMQKGWFLSLRVWGTFAYHVSSYLTWHDYEPMTESDRNRRVAELRAETLSVEELAEYLVEQDEGRTGVELSGTKRKQALKVKQREITARITDGTLKSGVENSVTMVEWGSIYDWLGQETPVIPDWAVHVQVVPDDQEEDIRSKRDSRDRRQQLQRAPINYALHRFILDSKPTNQVEEIARQMDRELRVGTERLWKELRAGEMVVNEVARGFTGDDPLDPDLRFVITALLEQLHGIVEDLEEFAGPVTLEEPDESLASDIRELVLRDFD